MRRSDTNRYRVDNVPGYLRPMFYLYSYFFAVVLLIYALIVHFTSKIEVVGQEQIGDRQNFIFCHWHKYIPLYGAVFLRNRRHAWMQHPLWYMKPIHLFLRFTGVKKIILGSTGHSGRQAADELVGYLKNGYSTVLLPDGPDGPPLKAKKGILHISQQSQVPIVPIQFRVSKYFETNDWDQKKWPIPFSKIKVQFGNSVNVSETPLDQAYAEITDALGD